MPYFREEETQVQMQQLAVYEGDGVGLYGGCTLAWDETTAQERELRRQTAMPVVAADAWYTSMALNAMDEKLREALRRFHTSSITFEMQARAYGHCAKSTWHERLLKAHPLFWECRDVIVGTARRRHRETENAIAASRPSSIDLDKPFFVPAPSLEILK